MDIIPIFDGRLDWEEDDVIGILATAGIHHYLPNTHVQFSIQRVNNRWEGMAIGRDDEGQFTNRFSLSGELHWMQIVKFIYGEGYEQYGKRIDKHVGRRRRVLRR